MKTGNEIFFTAWFAFEYLATPAALIVGWYRFYRSGSPRGVLPWFSLAAFAGANASVALAIGSIVYGHLRGGWAYYDPPLMRIYEYGFFISAGSLLIALVGIWKASALRWWSFLAGLGTLMFWIGAAASE